MYFSIVYEPTSWSNIGYLFQRFLWRLQGNILTILFITLAITIILTVLYYSYVMQLIKAEARALWAKIMYRFQPQRTQRQQTASQMYRRRRKRMREQRKEIISDFEDVKDNK